MNLPERQEFISLGKAPPESPLTSPPGVIGGNSNFSDGEILATRPRSLQDFQLAHYSRIRHPDGVGGLARCEPGTHLEGCTMHACSRVYCTSG